MNNGEVHKLYYTANEAAEFWGCGVDTVRFYCRNSLVPNLKVKGKYYITKNEVTRMWEEHFSPEAVAQAKKRFAETMDSLFRP